jgi:single-stranded-DNA-specific exonuclease
MAIRIEPYAVQYDQKRVDALALKCGTYSFLIDALLHRGYHEEDIYNMFVSPEVYEFQDFLPNALEAAKIIYNAICADTGDIHIFADYDVDGLTSGFVMYYALQTVIQEKKQDFQHKIYLKYPERSEGYGLSLDYCKQIVESGAPTSLLITVDNGISKREEVEYLKEHGIPVIITDHHEVIKNQLPLDCLIVNPCYNLQQRSYLAGVAVAYDVAKALLSLLNPDYIRMCTWHPVLTSFSVCVALGTVTDVMPQTPENLSLIKMGLKEMTGDKAPWSIKTILSFDKENLPITAKDLAFNLGPKLNAPGRLGNVKLAAQALFSREPLGYISKLEEINNERKALAAKARQDIAAAPEINETQRVVWFHGKDYPAGIYGTIAADLTKRYPNYLCVCYDIKPEQNIVSGSFRFQNGQIDLCDIFKQLQKKKLIHYFAGHPGAGVIQVKLDKIDAFNRYFSKLYDKAIKEAGDIEDTVFHYDYEISSLKQLQNGLLDIVNIIPLFGSNQISFYMRNVNIDNAKYSKSNPNNVQFTFSDNTSTKKVWAWGYGDKYKEIGEPKKVNLYFYVQQDFMYKDKPMLTLDILDISSAE